VSGVDDIPTLTDLIEKGSDSDVITAADLGFDDGDLEIEMFPGDRDADDPLANNPALEQAVRRILDEHMELAWQEIKLELKRHLDKS